MEAKPLFDMQKALVQPFQMCMLDIPLSVQDDDVSTLEGGTRLGELWLRGGGVGVVACAGRESSCAWEDASLEGRVGSFLGGLLGRWLEIPGGGLARGEPCHKRGGRGHSPLASSPAH